MAPGDSPTIARRRVRLALREARESAQLTQQQVADAMEWSLSKVIRIEAGDVSIAPNDLRPLLGYLGIKDRSRIDELTRDAKIARTRQRRAWYQAPEYREHLSDASRRLIEFEAEAEAIRYYMFYFIPGPLQTPEYAAALLAKFEDEMPPEQIRVRLEARRHRREALLARLGTVKIYALLDESVLMRPLGGAEVFGAQLQELQRLATARLVNIRMVPFSLDAPLTNNAGFDLLSLTEGDEQSQVVYRESGFLDELVEDRASTSRHHNRFDKVWHVARDEANTTAFIQGRIETLRASIAEQHQNS
jgi:transcriptional regulator with XRE-family HTH domain